MPACLGTVTKGSSTIAVVAGQGLSALPPVHPHSIPLDVNRKSVTRIDELRHGARRLTVVKSIAIEPG